MDELVLLRGGMYYNSNYKLVFVTGSQHGEIGRKFVNSQRAFGALEDKKLCQKLSEVFKNKVIEFSFVTVRGWKLKLLVAIKQEKENHFTSENALEMHTWLLFLLMKTYLQVLLNQQHCNRQVI